MGAVLTDSMRLPASFKPTGMTPEDPGSLSSDKAWAIHEDGRGKSLDRDPGCRLEPVECGEPQTSAGQCFSVMDVARGYVAR